LLIASIAVLRHNDTLKAYFFLHLLVWACRVLRLFWLSSTPRLIVKLFPCWPENLQFLLLLSDLLLCLRFLGWVLDYWFRRILLNCLLLLRLIPVVELAVEAWEDCFVILMKL
jgi:hypothetical protein